MDSSRLLDVIADRVLVLDGAMGTSLQSRDLRVEDYRGHENCPDILVLTRPELIRDIHRSFLAVGCDAVMTNTFGANRVVLAEFGMVEQTREMNRLAARIAREACTEFDKPSRPRFVIGSIGPGTRLPTLGQTTWDHLADSYREQARGLLEGGVDAIVVETCQDILQAKSAVVAVADAMDELGLQVPVFCTVTIETTGTMLLGTEIGAALTTLEAYDHVVGIGLNCATGPQEMSEHVRYLSARCGRLLVVQPNAGLPKLIDGRPHYPLTPEELARWLTEFVEVDGVNIVGGCCGTTPAHLAAVVDAMEGRKPKPRQVKPEPSVSSVYQSVPIRQDTDCLVIGERTNANGSKEFRALLNAGDMDGMVEMARQQVRRGSHLLDVGTARVGHDEVGDMTGVVKRFVTDVTVPLVIDSTETMAIEAALKLAGGKCVINSINLEEGEAKAEAICRLARRYGAALIALTIDEKGMAKTSARKLAVAHRIYDLAVGRHGVRPSDLLFDPLTFTICTGSPDDRRLGLETLEAIARIKQTWPEVHTVLGVSNISFGLKAAARRVVNSVFLHYARQRGLDAAILHASGILPLFQIDESHRRLAEDLLFDRRREKYDPLQDLLKAVDDVDITRASDAEARRSVEERLKQRIISGERRGLPEDLDEAMRTHSPLEIIDDILLDAMRTVGDLFGAGQMQLPFVLQSAETMKTAVRYLEPHTGKGDSANKGTIVLATVRGDVHDIGKNLVDIILTNNGYRVHNLGIKQPISRIIEACEECGADALGMSGLLVKSVAVMRENLAVLNERGISLPVILGGAALTRRYVEEELRGEYDGPLFYAPDAFAGLRLMEEITVGRVGKAEAVGDRIARSPVLVSAEAPAEAAGPHTKAPAEAAGPHTKAAAETAGPPLLRPDEKSDRARVLPRSDISQDEPVPQPPFWGSRVIEHLDPAAVAAYLNENALFQVRWEYRRNRRMPEEYERYLRDQVRPILGDLLNRCEREDILQLQAVYGFWPARSDGDTLIIYDVEDLYREIARFDFPRRARPPYWCISDFFKPVSGGVYDVAAFMVVTVGRRIGKAAHEQLAADRYQDYLHLHGLGVEMAEALAEYIHRRIRVEWGVSESDAPDIKAIFRQRYQGSRYSFGYPACPRLEDQVKLWPLLKPERIGVSLTEEFQLDPEQTTTGLIVHHRQAKYFSVR